MTARRENEYSDEVLAAADFVLGRSSKAPRLGVVLGSGIGAAGDGWGIEGKFPYSTIPNFPTGSVAGHAGELLTGLIGGTPAVIMSGRSHYYESGSMIELAFAIRSLCACGIDVLILTNSAGAVAARIEPGTMMVIQDHICLPALTGLGPLVGPNVGPGPRFPSMARAYDSELLETAIRAASELETDVVSGVYAMVGGPNYETPAEVRFLEALGADAVGMSTAAEAIVAIHCGVRVLGISVITNRAGIQVEEDEHEAVLQMAGRAARDVARVIEIVAAGIGPG